MAAEISKAKLGFKTRPIVNPVAATIGLTAAQVLRNNPDRIFWLVVNLGAGDVYLDLTSEVANTRGMYLSAGGGYASMQADVDGEAVSYEIYGIATIAANAVYVFEIEKAIEEGE